MTAPDLTAVPTGTSGGGSAISPQAGAKFVTTPQIEVLVDRCETYLELGLPVHLAGPPGTGKTTLALHIAARRGRPVLLTHGDDQLESRDLTARESGYKSKRVVDNYVHSVVRTEEEVGRQWKDSPLTTACREGHTLVYDEFSRSRAEANNVLLSVLAEGILPLSHSGEGPIRVHPEFRVLLTSNPAEYSGSHQAPDALIDRLVTVPVAGFDLPSEIAITASRAGISRREAELVVEVVREVRGRSDGASSLRSAIMIGRIVGHCGAETSRDDPSFRWACRDVLSRFGDHAEIDRALEEVCGRYRATERWLRPVAKETSRG